MEDLIIIGASGCGREIINWIDDINSIKPTWKVLGFLDDNSQALEGVRCRYRIIDSIKGHKPQSNVKYAMGIASPKVKKEIGTLFLEKGAEFASIIHPSTKIYTEYEMGVGLITYPNAKIATGVKIGNFVTLQSTILGHDAVLEDYVTVSSNCGITGGVVLHEGCFIGDHACISVGMEIGTDAYVGIGSAVIRNVPEKVKVFGNPARVYEKI